MPVCGTMAVRASAPGRGLTVVRGDIRIRGMTTKQTFVGYPTNARVDSFVFARSFFAKPGRSLLRILLSRREAIEAALLRLAPRIPRHECAAVTDHAMDSAGLRQAAPENAAWLSLVAYVRPALTNYEELLEDGYDQDSARFFVAEEMNAILSGWGVRRRLPEGD
jgi:hypothetical protein